MFTTCGRRYEFGSTWHSCLQQTPIDDQEYDEGIDNHHPGYRQDREDQYQYM